MLRSKQFGKFEIIRKLGRGMTDVYLGFDTSANRHAVLKIVEESPDSLTRIIMEAERRGAELQKQLHEFDSRVIEIYEYGDLDSYFFIAMQFIEGRNIAEILRSEKRLDPLRAATIASEICSQLDRLHSFTAEIDGQRRAVVHGDIKPSNVQIGLNDEVRLLDFGIAKAITFTHNLTHHNFGSPSYCSPERLTKAQVDSHADLWALGITLYEMVAGMPPYQAETTRKLEALIQSRRPPRALPEDCPLGLKAVITKALAGDLHQRYVSAAAFREDLQLFIQSRQTSAEKENRVAWTSNETIEKPRVDHATIDRKRPFLPKRLDTRRVASVLGLLGALLWGLLAGLLIFVPVGYIYRLNHQSNPLRANMDQTRRAPAEIEAGWDLYKRLNQHSKWLGGFSPISSLTHPLRASYVAAADDVIERYRNSSDPVLKDFDWPKAALCLQHALEMEPHDPSTRAKLALSNGYLALQRSSNPQEAKAKFEEAASLLPKSVDPHLALARLNIYYLRNIGSAIAEFHEAQRLGYQLGPREMEQQADGFHFRAVQELADARKLHGISKQQAAHALQLAQRDFDRARQLYEPIVGFSNVGLALNKLDDEDRVRQQLDRPAPKRVPIRKHVAWKGRR